MRPKSRRKPKATIDTAALFGGRVRITVENLEGIETPVLPSTPGSAVPKPAPVVIGPDLSAVNWRGTLYHFSAKQRLVFAALLEAREQGYEWVSQEHLLEAAESDCGRIRDLFRGHPAWGTLIRSAVEYRGPVGAYCLARDL